MNLKNKIRSNSGNILGRITKRIIVVSESDDWGNMRLTSKPLYDLLLLKGIPVNKNYFL